MICLLLLPLLCCVSFADQRIYYGAFQPGWDWWSWASSANYADTSRVHLPRVATISWIPNNYDGIYINGDIPALKVDYSSLDFWLFSTVSQTIKLRINPGATEVAVLYTIPASVWTRYSCPLSGVREQTINKIFFQATTSTNVSRAWIAEVNLTSEIVPPPPAVINVTVRATSNVSIISDLIYGVNFAESTHLDSTRYPINRAGGNARSRVNWEANIHNTAADWYFMNIPDVTLAGFALPNGSLTDQFGILNRGRSQWMLTANMLGYVPKDTRVKMWSYSLAAYPTQLKTECSEPNSSTWCTPDAGNGRIASGRILNSTLWTRAHKVVNSSDYNKRWVDHLQQVGLRPQFVSLDNEPDLWHSTHFDVHPSPMTLDELWTKTRDVARNLRNFYNSSMIKITGPSVSTWCAYFWSALDGCQQGTDFSSHGNQGLLDLYVRNICSYNTTNRIRLIDYLDVHYYSQSADVSLSSIETPEVVTRRFRAVKSLYRSGYVDQSFINQPIFLIPRMKAIMLNSTCGASLGLKLAITEWNFGNDNIWSGAFANAEALAIFGREGVDLATFWFAPAVGSIGENAFKLFLNFTGSRTRNDTLLNSTSVNSTSTHGDLVSTYSLLRSDKKQLAVLLFNKQSTTQAVNVTLTQVSTVPASAYRFSFGPLLSPAKLSLRPSVPIRTKSMSVNLTKWEVTLLIINSTSPLV